MMPETITHDLIDSLAESIARHTARRIPLSVDLWSRAEIAGYLKVTVRSVTDYCSMPDFPRAIRLPSRGPGRGHPLYKASEVIAWAMKHKERI